MSELKVDTLTGKTSAGDITVTSEGGAATMQLQQGLAKAWHNVVGTGTISIADALNVSSISDLNTGVYQINFSNNMSNAVYSAVLCSEIGGSAGGFNGTSNMFTSGFRHVAYTNGGALRDVNPAHGVVKGDLA